MSALLAGAGAELFGNKAIAVRSLFLMAGTAIPFLVFWLAQPLMTRTQSLEAALFSMCLPLVAFLGLLAVPDVPMIFLGLLLTGLFERATRLNTLALWVSVGVVAALGMSTHYRFSLYLLSGFIYLLLFRTQRHYLRETKLWIAVAIMSIGLLPTIRFNLDTELSGLDYHLLDRHPWRFQMEGLLHPLKQALLVTPPLYAALIITLYMTVKRSLAGDDRSGLFAVFSLVHLTVYMVLAPWTDSTRTSIHWPLSGYLPLLVYLPQTLRDIFSHMLNIMSHQAVRRLIILIPALGFTGTLVAFMVVGSQAFSQQLQPLLGTGVLSNKMAGWKAFNMHLTRVLDDQMDSHDILIVTDNYYTGAQIEFGVEQAFDVFNIDDDKAARDGRIVQYELWQNNKNGLLNHSGQNALFITEDSTLTIDDKLAVMRRACSIFQQLVFIDQLTLFAGDKSFSFYHGIHINGAMGPAAGIQGSSCPVPSQAWLDQPVAEAELSGIVQVTGWAFNDGGGIKNIQLLANGTSAIGLHRTIPRNDVIEIFKVEHDPNQPFVGFGASLDTSLLPNGPVDLVVEVTANSGETQRFRETAVYIKNFAQPADQ